MNFMSNIDVYLAIAEEAHASMRAQLSQLRTPKADGQPGYVIRSEPDRRSFKSAMVAIAFAAIYMDALTFIALQRRFGRAEALKIDRREHEERLAKLGLSDTNLQKRVRDFRLARNDLVHEKATSVDNQEQEATYIAQDTADSAMSLLRDLQALLTVEGP
jgi:hypothetical protein